MCTQFSHLQRATLVVEQGFNALPHTPIPRMCMCVCMRLDCYVACACTNPQLHSHFKSNKLFSFRKFNILAHALPELGVTNNAPARPVKTPD